MSSVIAINNYNPTEKTLKIVFHYDLEKMYTYQNVPQEIADGLKNAESQGKYFGANIRNKKEFPCSSEFITA